MRLSLYIILVTANQESSVQQLVEHENRGKANSNSAATQVAVAFYLSIII